MSSRRSTCCFWVTVTLQFRSLTKPICWWSCKKRYKYLLIFSLVIRTTDKFVWGSSSTATINLEKLSLILSRRRLFIRTNCSHPSALLLIICSSWSMHNQKSFGRKWSKKQRDSLIAEKKYWEKFKTIQPLVFIILTHFFTDIYRNGKRP